MEQRENLLGVVQTLFRWKKHILYTCLITGIGAIITVLLLPVYYKATTTFYAASPDLAVPEALFGSGSEAPDYYGTQNDIDRILGIARSGELIKFMVDSFQLYQRYDIDPATPRGAYEVQSEFEDHFDVKKTKYDAIELSVEDKDKETAARMANAARNKVNELAQKLVKESQFKIIGVYEGNIDNKNRELTSLNDSLQRVRLAFGVYNTEAQAENLSQLIAEAEGKLNNAQAKLTALQAVKYNRDTINLLSANISGFQNELLRLQERLLLFNQGMALVDVLSGTQKEASEQLAEDKERYKQIKAAYAADFPALLLLEEAPVPVIKHRPKRALLVLAAVAAALIFSVVGVIIFDTYREVNWREIIG
jgi:capsule polysaccharide export protein KpsE/RkpR